MAELAEATVLRSGEVPVGIDGTSFCLHVWRGSGPPHMHVHHEDDEAWHVLEGRLHFRLADRELDAGPGDTVVIPAGVAHTYQAVDARYLIVLTPRLRSLIRELQENRDRSQDPEIYARHRSEIVPE